MTDAGSVRGPRGGWEQFVARGDELVRVEVSNTEIAVVVEAPKGEVLGRTAIPYPTAGCGGYEILLSAKERYLAMFLYSGQSEVGCELFYFRPHLQHISSFGYVFGEGTGPVFSSDERWLALAWATNPLLCLLDEGVEHLPTGERLVDWVALRIQELPDGSVTSCSVRVRVGPGFPVEGDESFYPENLEIAGEEARFSNWVGRASPCSAALTPLAGHPRTTKSLKREPLRKTHQARAARQPVAVRSGRVEARIGLRMMPTFPRPPIIPAEQRRSRSALLGFPCLCPPFPAACPFRFTMVRSVFPCTCRKPKTAGLRIGR